MSLSSSALKRLLLLMAMLALLSGCSSVNKASNRLATTFSPYRIDVVQGNVVTREQAQILKPGMSRLQVRDLLGTPLLTSVFHSNRWDYVFTLSRQGAEPQARRVTVFFKGDLLERVEADELPSESEFAATLERSTVDPAKLPKLQASEEQLQQFPKPTAKPVENQAPPAAPKNYPPLETQPR